MHSVSKFNHHIVHLSVGFMGDPAGQLNTSANSGELATVRTLHKLLYYYYMIVR